MNDSDRIRLSHIQDACEEIIQIISKTYNPEGIGKSFSRNQSFSSCLEIKSLSLNSIGLADNERSTARKVKPMARFHTGRLSFF